MIRSVISVNLVEIFVNDYYEEIVVLIFHKGHYRNIFCYQSVRPVKEPGGPIGGGTYNRHFTVL